MSPIGARQIRPATPDDAAVIFDFIRALVEYEREPDAVVTRPEVLREQLGQARPPFECLLCEVEGRPVGFALFFPTWLHAGRCCRSAGHPTIFGAKR